MSLLVGFDKIRVDDTFNLRVCGFFASTDIHDRKHRAGLTETFTEFVEYFFGAYCVCCKSLLEALLVQEDGDPESGTRV